MPMSESRKLRTLLACWITSVALHACSGDDSEEPQGGSGGTAGATGGNGGAGMNGGNGGAAGDIGGNGGAGMNGGSGGAGMNGGNGGAAGDIGGDGGAGMSGGSGGSDMDGGDSDSGTDSGTPDDAFACVAPEPTTEFGLDCPDEDPVALQLTALRTDLGTQFPIFLTHAPDDESRLFVAMRNGEVLILDPEDGSTIGTFLSLTDQVVAATTSGGEYGLLGFAFHPNYPEDPRVFVNYTVGRGGDDLETLVASFEVSADPNAIDIDTEQVVVRYDQPQRNHNGGMIAFGKDNCLYVGSGDGGNGNDVGAGHSEGGNGQDLAKPLGKILRVDPDNPAERAPGNPEGPAYPHVWDYGIRNPWRFSFDRDTGDLYIGDVGQDAREEISVAPRGVGDNNFGWPIAEGAACRGGGGGCDMTGLVPPAVDYAHVEGGASENCVIGGYVYRGSAIPSLAGWYLYGDSGGGRRIRAFVWDGEGACETPIQLSERDGLTVNARITSFGEDAAGELYVTTSAGVYRFDEAE
jgi:glucose/arabinose dehydrogenase